MITPITQQGSNRRYFRESDDVGRTWIRVEGTSLQENRAFITMARHFHALGLNTPELYSVSEDGMSYTQQDLGDTLLFGHITEPRLLRTVQALKRLNQEGAKGMDWSVCYPVDSMNRRSIFWDLNYWKYCFLKLSGIEFLEDNLENDFEALADRLLREPQDCFMMRDCQSRNVMLTPDADAEDGEKIYFIDFQGGRRGPKYYDIVSLLWQAKANLPQDLRERMLEAYGGLDRETVNHFVLFRTLQVMGAYGYRGYFERKPHFLESIPFAITNLKTLFASSLELRTLYPYIYAISQRL